MLKLERIRDYLLMEEEFIQNQELRKPREQKNLVIHTLLITPQCYKRNVIPASYLVVCGQAEVDAMNEIRGVPMEVGTLEEILDENHAIVSTGGGREEYVLITSFVDRDLLFVGCSVLLHHKVSFCSSVRREC